MSKPLGLLLAALSCAALSAVQAAPITYNFSGTFSASSAPVSGVAFSGQLQYDPAAALSFGGGNFKDYAIPAGALSVSAGGGVVISGAGTEEVINGVSNLASVYGDVLRVMASGSTGTGVLDGFGFIELYQDIDLNVLQSLTLPAQMLALGDPRLQDMGFIGIDNANYRYIEGAITCFSTSVGACGSGTSVPEPGTLALVALGLLAGIRPRGQQVRAGRVVLDLWTAWRDGTTHLVISQEFMHQLAAPVPGQHLHSPSIGSQG